MSLSPSQSIASTPRASPHSPLLTLPLEIRLDIYNLLLVLPPITKEEDYNFRNYASTSYLPTPSSSPIGAPAPIATLGQDNDRDKGKSHSRVHAAILSTCQQIHAEALPILYSQNTFVAHPSLLTSFPRLRIWYPPVREARLLPYVRRIYLQIRLDCDAQFTRRAATAALSNLDELHLDLAQSVFLGVGYSNLDVLEGIRGVRSVSVGGSTTGFEKYIDWLTRSMARGDDEELMGRFEPEEDDLVQRLCVFP